MKLGQGNVFTGVCDSVHRGGVSGKEWRPPSRETPRGTDPPWEQTPPGTRPPQPEQTPPGTDPPPEADSSIRSTSGRYASYWNAFLYYKHWPVVYLLLLTLTTCATVVNVSVIHVFLLHLQVCTTPQWVPVSWVY